MTVNEAVAVVGNTDVSKIADYAQGPISVLIILILIGLGLYIISVILSFLNNLFNNNGGGY